jgi:hypothetical protein
MIEKRANTPLYRKMGLVIVGAIFFEIIGLKDLIVAFRSFVVLTIVGRIDSLLFVNFVV